MDTEKEKHSEKKRKKIHILPTMCFLIFLIICFAYGYVAYYFQDHFFYHTKLLGEDCSLLTAEEAEELVDAAIQNYQITLTERDGQKEILTASQIGLSLKAKNSIKKCMDAQPSYAWITMLWKKYDYKYELSVGLNEEKFDKAIAMLDAEQEDNIIEPKDAYMTYNEVTKKYNIVAEICGNQIDNDKLKPSLKSIILLQGKSYDLEENECYLSPKVYSTDETLNKQVNNLNAYMSTTITYDFGDRKEVIDSHLLKEWISLNDQNEAVLNKSKVKAYVKKLAKKYDTLGISRSFTSICGNKVKVSGGTYGWKMDQDKEYEALLSMINKHESKTRTPEYKHIAKSRKKNDLGDTYIEIDLSKQHMWFYKNGETFVSTDVVTGDTTKGRDTPTGVYYIVFKQTDHVLKGQGYASHVDYWMPFIEDRGIGIHDASWRSSYGGSIYKGNGSHGCVNTPRDAVKKIFNNIEASYPVVVHW